MPFILTFLVLWASSIAFQPITVPNRALVGHVYRSLYDIDWINCIQSCQDDPNCSSYNFVRLLNGLGQCEMIDCGLEDFCKTEGLVFSTGSIFQQIVPTGGTETCESSVHDHESHADFSLLFPSPQSVESYVEGRRINQEFTKLSVCFWVKATSNHISVFSYRGTRGKKEMALEIYDTNYLKLTVGEQSKNVIVNSVNDGHWHHICVAWENAEGQWAIFKDGSVVVDNKKGFQVGYNIRPGGKLFIGQEQTGEKNFDSKRSFVGELADFNFWPEYVTDIEVLSMSKYCINRKGDVYKWSKLRHRIKGKVVVIRPSSCRP